jgi:hypothetical protein
MNNFIGLSSILKLSLKGGPGSGVRGHRTNRDKPNSNGRGHFNTVSRMDIASGASLLSKEGKVSIEEAKELIGKVNGYSALNGYRDISSGRDKEGNKKLERFISVSPKWNGGPLYRGVGLKLEVLQELKNGSIFNYSGVSSWTSDLGVGKDFARFISADKESVMFKMKGKSSNYATSIKHLSRYPNEGEVLMSKSKLKILSTAKEGNTTIFTVKRVNG